MYIRVTLGLKVKFAIYKTDTFVTMKLLTSNWHMGRIFRAVAGLIGLGMGLYWNDSLMGIAGGILLIMGITDKGFGSKK